MFPIWIGGSEGDNNGEGRLRSNLCHPRLPAVTIRGKSLGWAVTRHEPNLSLPRLRPQRKRSPRHRNGGATEWNDISLWHVIAGGADCVVRRPRPDRNAYPWTPAKSYWEGKTSYHVKIQRTPPPPIPRDRDKIFWANIQISLPYPFFSKWAVDQYDSHYQRI